MTAPFTRTVIRGSNNSVSAPSPQTISGRTWAFLSWSTHNVKVNADTSLIARYRCTAPLLRCLLG